ncbi:MAG: chorismate mutase [Myxococcota bacterium]
MRGTRFVVQSAPMHPGEEDLQTLRREVDALDRALVGLLADRRAAVTRIAVLKRGLGMPGRDPVRERAILEGMMEAGADRGVPRALVARVLEAVLEDSRDIVGG